MRIRIRCSNCEQEFERLESRVKPEHNFCSYNCYHTFIRENKHLRKYKWSLGSEKISLVCDYCGKSLSRTKGAIVCKNNFCNPICYANSMRSQEGFITTLGYKKIWVRGTLVWEHRHIMEQHLGRHLLEIEVVHHSDENKLNNSIENLYLMGDSEHKSLHAKGRRKKSKTPRFA